VDVTAIVPLTSPIARQSLNKVMSDHGSSFVAQESGISMVAAFISVSQASRPPSHGSNQSEPSRVRSIGAEVSWFITAPPLLDLNGLNDSGLVGTEVSFFCEARSGLSMAVASASQASCSLFVERKSLNEVMLMLDRGRIFLFHQSTPSHGA
jgi:hypothetical protein